MAEKRLPDRQLSVEGQGAATAFRKTLLTGVMRVVELCPHGASLALVMERWCTGSLDQLLLQGPLPVGTALQIGTALARALGQVHRKGIVHRDIKPQSISSVAG